MELEKSCQEMLKCFAAARNVGEHMRYTMDTAWDCFNCVDKKDSLQMRRIIVEIIQRIDATNSELDLLIKNMEIAMRPIPPSEDYLVFFD